MTLKKFIKIITDEWSIKGRDISDIGNIIGVRLAEESPDIAQDFLWGVEHGISLIDGTHDEEYKK